MARKKTINKWSGSQAEKDLLALWSEGLVTTDNTAGEVFELRDSFKLAGKDLFKRHWYKLRKEKLEEMNKNAGKPPPSSKFESFVVSSCCQTVS